MGVNPWTPKKSSVSSISTMNHPALGSYSGEEIVIQTNLALQWDMNVIEWVLNHRECANWKITIFHEINSKSLNQVGLGLFANCEIINDGG